MDIERLVGVAGPVAVLAGATWAVAPVPTMLVGSRWINAVYVLPLGLLVAGLAALRLRTDAGPVGDIGYGLTLGGVVLTLTGSLLQAAFSLAQLAQWGVAGGLVFFGGFYTLLGGSLFLGVGLWGEDTLSRAGPVLLVLSLPVALVGFRLFNSGGLAQVNWVPFTVPYGTAWVVLGYDLWSRGRPAA